MECQENLRVLEKGVIADGAASRVTAKVQGTLDHLQELSTRDDIKTDRKAWYQSEVSSERPNIEDTRWSECSQHLCYF
jgi:hypothetical protein